MEIPANNATVWQIQQHHLLGGLSKWNIQIHQPQRGSTMLGTGEK